MWYIHIQYKYIYIFLNIIEIFILNYWFMEYLLNLFRRSNFACCLQVFRPKCITTFSGFQSAAVQLLHWFLAKWSSVWDGHLMRCIPVVRGCWFRWWCYSSHFEQAHCRYHILCNYSLCSSLSWGGPCVVQVLVGRVISGTSFDPKFAMLVQNKEQKTRRLWQVQKLCPRSALFMKVSG